MNIDWKKRCLIYEEYLVTKFGMTIETFSKWLKIYHPEEVEEFTALTGSEVKHGN